MCCFLPKPSPTLTLVQLPWDSVLSCLFRDLFFFQLSNHKPAPLTSSLSSSFHLYLNILWSHSLKQTDKKKNHRPFPRSLSYLALITTILFGFLHIQTSLKQCVHSCSLSPHAHHPHTSYLWSDFCPPPSRKLARYWQPPYYWVSLVFNSP